MQSLVSHGQAAELLQVGLEEFQVVGLEEVETLAAEGQTLGERECILDGQAHVGYTELRLY